MKKNIQAGDYILAHGRAQYAAGRTISDATGLDPETELVFLETRTRWRGTGYTDSLWRVVGSNDLLVIHHNSGPPDNIGCDNAELLPDKHLERRNYSRDCRKASTQTGLPFEVCLAVGPEHASEFAELVKKVRRVDRSKSGPEGSITPYVVCPLADHELFCGLGRRKLAVIELLPDMSEGLREKIEGHGQENSWRLARFFRSI